MSTDTLLDLPEIVDPAAPKKVALDITKELALVGDSATGMDKLASGLAELAQRHPIDVVLDLWKPDDAKRADEGRKAYKQARVSAEKARKDAKAPLLALGRAIDAFAGDLEAQLRIGENYFLTLQASHEDAVRARREGFHAKMARLAAMPDNARSKGLSSDEIAKGVAYLDSAVIGDEWAEFKAQAEQVRRDTLVKLREVYAAAMVREDAVRKDEEARQAALHAGAVDKQTGEIMPEDQGGQVPEAATPGDGMTETPSVIPAPSPAPTHAQPAVMVAQPAAQAAATENHETPAAPGVVQGLDDAPTLKLGVVCERLGFTVSHEFIEHTLGILSVPAKGRAVMFHEHQWKTIKTALVRHIEGLV